MIYRRPRDSTLRFYRTSGHLVSLPGHRVEIATGSTILLLLVPQIHKQFSCCWSVPGIVIVAERENFQDFGVAHQRFENLNLIPQIASTVDETECLRSALNLSSFN